jgi:hypothetical protein
MQQPMNRARLFTCITLVLIAVGFVAVWMTIPSGHDLIRAGRITHPARFLAYGLRTQVKDEPCSESSDPMCNLSGNNQHRGGGASPAGATHRGGQVLIGSR